MHHILDGEMFSGKGVMMCRILTPSGPVAFYTTHVSRSYCIIVPFNAQQVRQNCFLWSMQGSRKQYCPGMLIINGVWLCSGRNWRARIDWSCYRLTLRGSSLIFSLPPDIPTPRGQPDV